MEQMEKRETPGYVPRPAWQVWAARVGLVLFVALMVWEMVRMAKGWY